MLRGEEKKEQKNTKKQKKIGLPGETAGPATQNPKPPVEAASTNTTKGTDSSSTAGKGPSKITRDK